MQVGEIFRELSGEQHALVDEGARREAREVDDVGAEETLATDFGAGALAHDVELALKGELAGELGGAADEDLADGGLAGFGGFAKVGVVGGDAAPAEELEALALHDGGDLLLDLAALGRVFREEDEAGAVVAGGGERDAGFLGDLGAEGVRDLDEDAGAVAGIGLAAGGAAVVEIFEDLDALAHEVVRGTTMEIGDEADAASVVLEPRVVEALFGGAAGAPGDGRGGGGSGRDGGGAGEMRDGRHG